MVDLNDYQKIMENIGIGQMIFQGPPGTSKTFESKKFILLYIPFRVNHLHGQTEPVPRRMRTTLTETEPVLFDANYQAIVC